MRWKLITGIILIVLYLTVAPMITANEQGVKGEGKAAVASGVSGTEKDNFVKTLEVPSLLKPIPNESETDKLKRMIQFIKETKPKPFIGTRPSPELPFCKQFMEDLINMHGVKAIEPDFVTGSEEEVAEKEVIEKLNLKHCEDLEHYSIIPPDVNPLLYRRGTLGFNYLNELGGPPYRFYKIQLVPGKKTKYPILYYNATIKFLSEKYGEVLSGHTGFARLDLKKCEIKDEKGGYSEVIQTRKPTLFEIGRNVLVRYKGQVFALMLEYSASTGGYSYRLYLERISIPITKGRDDCLWSYHSERMKELGK